MPMAALGSAGHCLEEAADVPLSSAAGSQEASSPSQRRHGEAPERRPRRYIAEPLMLNSRIGLRRSEIEDLLALFWCPAAIFVFAEFLALLGLRKSFFVALTEGQFDLGPRYAEVVEVHVWASGLMWALGAVQITCERLRKRPESAWRHRRLGEAMLGLFFAVVLPTSMYLTFLQRIDYAAAPVGAVLLDTAFCTAYFLFRGWRVARKRRNARSMALHGRLMQCGVVMSMSILPQRFLQLYLTVQLHGNHQLNYTFSILVTSILFVLFGHFTEGPRGGVWLASIGAENAEEAYGSATPGSVEKWAWRLRWIVYMLIYSSLHRVFARPK